MKTLFNARMWYSGFESGNPRIVGGSCCSDVSFLVWLLLRLLGCGSRGLSRDYLFIFSRQDVPIFPHPSSTLVWNPLGGGGGDKLPMCLDRGIKMGWKPSSCHGCRLNIFTGATYTHGKDDFLAHFQPVLNVFVKSFFTFVNVF